MGGAAGHISSLHENRALTFGELKEVLTKAAEGNLEQCTEKFDGINLVFTWSEFSRDIKVARSGSDIKNGGMNAEALSALFAGRENIQTAFDQAFQVLRQAINSLSTKELTIFSAGRGMNYWYSIEIIYPSGANVINYDSNCIVFHRQPVFESGLVTRQVSDLGAVDFLSSRIESMQKAISLRDWKIMGPSFVELKNLRDGLALQRSIVQINKAMTMAGVDDSSTLGDYLMSMAIDRSKSLGVGDFIASALARRLMNEPGAPNVTRLVKMSPRHATKIIEIVKRDKELIAEFMRPIELAISDLACAVLSGMNSVLIKDRNKELHRLKSLVSDAIQAVRASGDVSIIDKLEKHVNKLHTFKNISSTMEGIVFVFKGQAWKMTGAWAPAHQILSLYKKTAGTKDEK